MINEKVASKSFQAIYLSRYQNITESIRKMKTLKRYNN